MRSVLLLLVLMAQGSRMAAVQPSLETTRPVPSVKHLAFEVVAGETPRFRFRNVSEYPVDMVGRYGKCDNQLWRPEISVEFRDVAGRRMHRNQALQPDSCWGMADADLVTLEPGDVLDAGIGDREVGLREVNPPADAVEMRVIYRTAPKALTPRSWLTFRVPRGVWVSEWTPVAR